MPPLPPTWPVLQFERSSYDLSENGQIVTINVIRNGSTAASASVNYAITGGTAVPGSDFLGGAGILRFNAGATVATLNLTIINDAIYEGSEKIVLFLSNPVNVSIGNNSTTVNIADDDAPPAIRFSASSYTVRENQSTVTLLVYCNGSTSLSSSVRYSVNAGNATAGVDYTGGSGTLSFAPGTMSASFSLGIVNDFVYEGNQTIILSLSSPVNSIIGGNGTTTVVIQNDDAAPTLRFSTTAYAVNESAGNVTISANLTGNTELPAFVNYRVTGGNATAGIDYAGDTGTMSFSPGTVTTSFNINIINDKTLEGNESIILSLSSPQNAVIVSPGTTTVTIFDDDAPPVPTYNFSLVAGWNLIALPLTPQDNSIAAVFPANVLAGLIDIWGWDEAQQNWVYYSPDPDDYFYQYYPAITRMETGKAYWVEMNQPASFALTGTVPGNAPKGPTTLVSGWSFVGLTGLSASTPAALYPDAIDVWGWDATRQNWVYYSPDQDDYFYQYYDKINTVQPGLGFWVEMT